MNEGLALLYELQLADSGIRDRERALAALDDGSGSRAELAAAEHRLAAAEKRLHDDQTTLRDKELRLASIEQEQADKHKKAYGGLVSDPKELAALERKIEELTQLKSKLEDEILALMDSVEEQRASVVALREEVERLRARAADVEEHYRMERTRLEQEIQELQARRTELAAQAPPQLLAMYEQLRQRLGGVAVAGVVDGRCNACHNAVPRDMIDRIPRSEMPIRCETCRRILWVVS
ncbi:MAG: hypothetical protein N2512_00660 [Armatimonadetes bacterium]|nr:hypothetical protein [Armatimonadota bacterium]